MTRVIKTLPITLIVGLLSASPPAFSQERFNDVRQGMADFLTAVKTGAKTADFDSAEENLSAAGKAWTEDVKPLILEGVRTSDQFQEYFDRIPEVEAGLAELARGIERRDPLEVERRVNSVIWAISHHPRGFDIPQPRYTAWDWVFGLSIGIGFCILAVVSGLYLRRSYYRRYSRSPAEKGKG
jgi:hypothetical protein